MRSTKANVAYFKAKKDEKEVKNLKLKQEFEKKESKIYDASVTVVRQVRDSEFLSGSVRPADALSELERQNIKVSKSQLKINNSI